MFSIVNINVVLFGSLHGNFWKNVTFCQIWIVLEYSTLYLLHPDYQITDDILTQTAEEHAHIITWINVFFSTYSVFTEEGLSQLITFKIGTKMNQCQT